MRLLFLASLMLAAGIAYVSVFDATDETPASREQAAPTNTPTTTDANRLLQGPPGFFVPNLGQWDHPARFVHRSGPMTLFLKDRGWVLDLVERPAVPDAGPRAPVHQAMAIDGPDDGTHDGRIEPKIRGVALQMTFEGDAYVPDIVGEGELPGRQRRGDRKPLDS